MLNIPTWNVLQYKTNVAHLVQQKDSRFAMAVTADTYTGEGGAPVNQMGPATATKRVTRDSDTALKNLAMDRRWVYPIDYDWATLVDRLDTLRTITDPTNPLAEAGRMAVTRAKDDEIIAAFFADAKTGVQGGTTTAFATATQQVAAGGTGLTVAKLRAARKILRANEVDLDAEEAYVALDADKEDDLLADIQVTNRDYSGDNENGKPVLRDGKVMKFMGFTFIHSERLQTSGGNLLVPCWVKSGMHLGSWADIQVSVGPRADKNNATQVQVTATIGATRLEEKKVVQILCA